LFIYQWPIKILALLDFSEVLLPESEISNKDPNGLFCPFMNRFLASGWTLYRTDSEKVQA